MWVIKPLLCAPSWSTICSVRLSQSLKNGNDIPPFGTQIARGLDGQSFPLSLLVALEEEIPIKFVSDSLVELTVLLRAVVAIDLQFCDKTMLVKPAHDWKNCL